MGTSTNDLRINVSVEEREARRRLEAVNRAQEGVAKTADRSTRAAARSSQARSQAEKAHAQALRLVERSIAAAERRSITFGLRGVEAIRAQRDELLRLARTTGQSEQQIQRITNAYRRMEDQVARTANRARDLSRTQSTGLGAGGAAGGGAGGLATGALIARGGGALAAGFLGVEGVRRAIAFAEESVSEQARAQQLGRSLDVLSRQFNVNRDAITRTERALAGMGLTSVQSRESILRLTRAGADQADILRLMQVSFDAAARQGITLEHSVDSLALGIERLSPQIIDNLGIQIKLGDVQERYAKALGLTNAESLTAQQRSKALIQAITEQAAKGGEFNETAGDISRSLLNLEQETKRAKEAFGGLLEPFAKPAVDAAVSGLQSLTAGIEQAKRAAGAPGQFFQRLRTFAADPFRLQGFPTAPRPREQGPPIPVELTPEQKKGIEQTKQLLQSAQLSELTGIQRIIAERRIYLAQLEKTPEAVRNVMAAFAIQIRQEQQAIRDRAAQAQRTLAGIDFSTARSPIGNQLSDDTPFRRSVAQAEKELAELPRIHAQVQDQILDSERRRIDAAHDLAVLRAEGLGAVTIEQKVGLERQKLDIEIDYLKRSAQLHDAKIRQDINREIAANSGLADQLLALQRRLLDENAASREAAITAATQRTANRQTQIIVDENQRIFDTLKRQAEGVFDALFIRTGSFFSRLSGLFQQFALTGVKDFVTTRTAQVLGGVGFGRTGAGGLFGGFGRAGAPGGTVGIAGPVGLGLGGTAARGALTGAGVAGGLAGLKALFGIGAATPTFLAGGGLATTGTTLGSVLGSTGAGLAGLGIAAASIAKGGLTGILGGAGGGALAGFAFGGPIGAAIGAAVGGIAGTIRSLFDSAKDKARSKVKQFYGVEIRDKSTLEQIVGIAKTAYNGNLDVAIASPQVRDLVELYSMAHGQGSRGLGIDIVTARLVQRGGQLYQEPTYRYGTPVLAPSRLPVAGLAAGQQFIQPSVSISLDRRATVDLWQGEMVNLTQNNPRVIANATQRAQQQNYDRRGAFGRAAEPSTVLA